MSNTIFSSKVVKRLSRYRLALRRFKDLGYTKVVSNNLGEEVGLTASQVRKDFSTFGISGNKKGGYQVDELLEHLRTILGKNRNHKLIVVGMGSIGTALVNYKAFEHEGIEIIAGFDIDPAKINKKGKIPILPIEKLEDYVKSHRIRTGIVAVPAISAQTVCDQMISAGIRGILNFAPIQLKAGDEIVITYVNVLSKLENVLYFVEGLGQNS